MEKAPRLKKCRTVGELIKELEKLPKRLPIEHEFEDYVLPVVYNAGEDAKEAGLRLHMGFE